MPISLPIGAQVRVVYATGAIPVILHGAISSTESDTLAIELTDGAALPAGARVILEPLDRAATRAIVEVASHTANMLVVRLVRIPTRDQREYPRLQGLVTTRYRIDSGDQAAAWLRGDPIAGAQHTPEPFMNFSATGLAFEDLPHAKADDRLLIDFSLPGDPAVWRATARVVRVWPLSADERDSGSAATHRVAVFFEDIPQGATDALTRYTLRIQQVLLEGPLREPAGGES